MTSKLMLVPDTHVVVPKEFLNGQLYSLLTDIQNGIDSPATCQIANSEICKIDKIMAAPQPTTPPVLRWEGNGLFFQSVLIARTKEWSYSRWEFEYWGSIQTQSFDSEQEARRAAEKALGLPEIEEV